MKRFLKIILLCIVFVAGFAAVARAQDASQPLVFQIPSVFIKQVSFENSTKSFKAGDTIRGTVDMYNNRNATASDVYYAIMLVGGYDDENQNTPTIVFDQKIQGPIQFTPSEEKKLPFEYTLPKTVPGVGLGIKIQAITKSGVSLGWVDEPITVLGTKADLVTVEKTQILANDTTYSPEVGPTLKDGSGATYEMVVHNPSTKDITLVPKLRVYNKTIIASEPLATETSPQVTVKAKSKQTITIPLPTFNNTARVYAGTLSLVDTAGTQRAPLLSMRYIVPGDIVSIHAVTPEQLNTVSGQSINVGVVYTGAPEDFETDERAQIGQTQVVVSVMNDKGTLIGQGNSTIDFNTQNSGTKVVPVSITESAQAFLVKAAIVKNEVILASYETPLMQATEAGGNKNTALMIALAAVVALALILTIIYVITRASKKVMVMFVGLLIIGAGFTVFKITVKAQAVLGPNVTVSNSILNDPSTKNQVYGDSRNYALTSGVKVDSALPLKIVECKTCTGFEIVVNPLKSTVRGNVLQLEKGETFSINDIWKFWECNNTAFNGTFTVTQYNDDGTVYSQSANTITTEDYPNTDYWLITGNHNVGPMKAYTTTGTKTIRLKWDTNRTHAGYHKILEADLTVQVVEPSNGEIEIVQVDRNKSIGQAYSSGIYLPSNIERQQPDLLSTANPHRVTDLAVGSYTVLAEETSDKILNAAVCTYPKGGTPCSLSNASYNKTVSDAWSKYKSVTASVFSNTVTRVAFRYDYEGDIVVPPTGGPLSVTCSASPNNAVIGQTVTWSSEVSGGSGSYQYQWFGDDGLIGSSANVTIKYIKAGLKDATVEVTDLVAKDENGNSIVNQCNAAAINIINPTFIEK